MVEFAIVGPVFFFLLFMVFEISYDLFLQAVLNSSLAVTGRQMQINTTQNATPTGTSSFTAAYFCPNSFGFLNCNNLYIRDEIINTSTTSTCTDLYYATTGVLPVSGGVLQLGSFTSQNGFGAGGTVSVTNCDASSTTGYCNPGPSEMVLLTAIYVAPSFLNGLMPGTQVYKYNGNYVRAQLASTAFETEAYTASAARPNPC
jgi:hypothetical protein